MSIYWNKKRRKKSKLWIELPLSILVVLLLLFNSLLIWVATGPRSLSGLTPYIEQAFHSSDNDFSVKIGETVLLWDGWRHPIDIRLHDVSVLTKEGAVFSKFPEIALGVHVPSLLIGQLLPTSLTISKPIISLFQNDDRSVSFGFSEQMHAPETTTMPASNAAMPFALLLDPLLSTDSSNRLRKLQLVAVHGASISLGNTKQGVLLDADATDIEMTRSRHGEVKVSASTTIHYGNYTTPVKVAFDLKKDAPTINGTVDFSEVQPSLITTLLPATTLPATITMPVSGQFAIALDMNGALQSLGFSVDMGKGTIHSDKLSGPVAVTKLHAEGELSNSLQDLLIKNLAADLDGMPLEANGTIKGLNGEMAVNANASIKKVPTEKVKLFWPLGVSPISREWVTTSVTGGMIDEASIKLAVPAGDFSKPVLPKEDVDANMLLTGAKIKYLPDHPPLENVDAKVHIDGLTLQADLQKANFLKETKLSNGNGLIDDLNADNPLIQISADLATSTQEAVKILGLPRINQAQRLGLTERGAGEISGRVELGFHFFAPKGKSLADDMTYKMALKLADVSQPALMEKYELRDIDGTLNIDEKSVEFKGKGNINGATLLDASAKFLTKSERGFTTFLDATGGMQAANLARFGLTPPSFLNGLFGFKVSVKQGAEVEHYDASVNLTETAVNLPKLGWTKEPKQPAKFNFDADKKGDTVEVTQFELSGQDVSAKGLATLIGGDVKKLSATDVVLGKTSLDMVGYDASQGSSKFDVRGKSLNLTGYMKGDSDFSFEHFPAVDAKLDIAQLIMGEGRELAAVKGDLQCDVKLCTSANISGKSGADGKPFQLRIMRNPKGKRQFSLHAENAGAFFKSLDLIDGMQGGDLSITGNYDDAGAHSLLRGKIDITSYTIKDAPILAKILSLASLTGFLDTMQGNGIAFKRLTAPFTLQNDVITFEKAKTYGSAMGMTAEGTITMPKTVFDINGTVVPSYSANTAVGKVPLVGKLLTGGEGQGVFAARYSVKGTEKAPDVSVNPLSILTPGFLRGLFDAFDETDSKDEEKKEE